MSEKKAAGKTTSTKTEKAKARKKTPEKLKKDSVAQRAAAVAKNIGKTQSLSDFLNGAGWR
jgi:hypothetical protein